MDEKKLEEMYRMVQENNAMLHSARRAAFVNGIFKIIWWVAILIVLPYVTWLYLQPYLTTVMDQYQSIQAQGETVKGQAAELQKNINDLRGSTGWIQDLMKRFGIEAQ